MPNVKPIIDERELELVADASSTLESFTSAVEKRGYAARPDKEESGFQEDDEFLREFYEKRKKATKRAV